MRFARFCLFELKNTLSIKTLSIPSSVFKKRNSEFPEVHLRISPNWAMLVQPVGRRGGWQVGRQVCRRAPSSRPAGLSAELWAFFPLGRHQNRNNTKKPWGGKMRTLGERKNKSSAGSDEGVCTAKYDTTSTREMTSRGLISHFLFAVFWT